MELPLIWSVGCHQEKEAKLENLIPAEVPGAVQLDWAKTQGWPDYWIGNNFQAYQWMESHYWTYLTQLDFQFDEHKEEIWFICGGIDYQFQIFLNGELLLEQEGMFTPVELNLTGKAQPGAALSIRIYPPPKSVPEPADRAQADHSCKPAVSYGWDFHPRLIPSGIWQEASLQTRPRTHLLHAELRYQLSADFHSVEIEEEISLSCPGEGSIVWTLLDPQGKPVVVQEAAASASHLQLRANLSEPQLWWPHDHGTPHLYTSQVEWRDGSGQVIDQKSQRIGFRRVRLVMYEGAWDAPVPFPFSRNPPPITLEVNGRQIFAKGSNWVSPHIFPGKITRETYLPLLQAVVATHLNIVRMWGGAIVQKEAFFDLCDELGIMVWQEFPLSCNLYPDDAAYLAVLDQESRSIIRRLRPHPSVVLWCGGNELFNSWSRMTDQSLALRLLNRNCFDLDPSRPFLLTSPLMDMGHGFYLFYNPKTDQDAFSFFSQAGKTAYTEFGIGATSSPDHLRSFIPESELFPPRAGTAWETHHGIGAWGPGEGSWVCQSIIEKYLGPSHTLEDLCQKSQELQAQGYRALFEEARRQKPRCAMVMNWCFNEPWPAAANNSLIAWPFHPKPALGTVKSACRPILASARLRKCVWEPGEIFDPELWLLNDSPNKLNDLQMEAFIQGDEGELFLLDWKTPPLEANRNLVGPTLRFKLPAWQKPSFHFILRVLSHPEFDSAYPLVFRPPTV